MEPTKNYSNKSFNDIIFEYRNKMYGSYLHRELLKKYTLRALGICVFLFIFGCSFVFINFSFLKKSDLQPLHITEITLSEPPPLLDVIPPAVPPTKQKTATDELTEMKVVDDNKVRDEKTNEIDEKTDSSSIGSSEIGSDKKSLENGDGSAIYANVEVKPQYPGGSKGLEKYLKDNVKYPNDAKENGIEGTVVVVFVVNEDGTVSDAKVISGIGGGCDQEALRVVNGMRRWKPGKQGGLEVKVYQKIPIAFKLED